MNQDISSQSVPRSPPIPVYPHYRNVIQSGKHGNVWFGIRCFVTISISALSPPPTPPRRLATAESCVITSGTWGRRPPRPRGARRCGRPARISDLISSVIKCSSHTSSHVNDLSQYTSGKTVHCLRISLEMVKQWQALFHQTPSPYLPLPSPPYLSLCPHPTPQSNHVKLSIFSKELKHLFHITSW